MQSATTELGYSLYELMMTLVLVGIVLTLGLPSFGGLVADKRLRAEVDALFHAVHLARKESIVRRRVVSICPSDDGQNCVASNDWSNGWIMFVNKGLRNTLQRDAGEELLRQHKVGGRSQITANRQGFSLRSTHLRATNGTIVFCDRAARTPSRALVISYTGRPRVTRKNSRGKAYTCAK